MNVYVCEEMHPAALEFLQSWATLVDDPALAEGVITRNFAVDRMFMEKCPRLRAHENVRSVAEHIAALLLALARKIPKADRMARAGTARTADGALCGTELFGKTLGLVGAGEIGCEAGRILQKGFGMKLRVFSAHMTPQRADALGMVFCSSLKELFRTCDAVTVGLPLTEATQNLIGRQVLNAAKPGLLLINTSRGGVVDEDALR